MNEPRRRFQFHMRTWFVVTTIVAVQCAVCFPAVKEWQIGKRLRCCRRIGSIIWWVAQIGSQVTRMPPGSN